MYSPTQKLAASILAMPTIVYMAFFQHFRDYDEYGLAVPIVATLIMIVVMKDIRLFAYLIPFYVFSVAILALSIYDMMPDSWTRYRETYAAFRQWAWLPILTLSATSCYYLIKINWKFISRKSLILAIALFSLSRIIRYYTFGFPDMEMDFFIYGIDNENSVIFALFSIYILYESRSKKISLLLGVILFILCSSATSRMAALLVISMLVTQHQKAVVVATSAASIGFLLISQAFVLPLYQYDPNSSFRALIWRDSTAAIMDTYGIGVGYGTEYIRNDFRAIPADFKRYVAESAADRLFVGTHSSVYDVTMRVGVLGFILLLGGIWLSLRGKVTNTRFRNLYFSFLGGLIVNNTFNMGLASINITLGAGLFLAIVMVVRDLSREGRQQVSRGGKMPGRRRAFHSTTALVRRVPTLPSP